MSIIENKFPILKNPVTGLTALVILVSCLINIWVFQDFTELPKIIVWYIGVGLILLSLAYYKKEQKFEIPKFILVSCLASIVMILIGSIFSFDPINSLFGFFPRYVSSVAYFGSWFIFLIALGLYTANQKFELIKVVILVSGLIAGLAILQSFGIAFYGGTDEGIRSLIPSFFGNPNFSAMFVATTVPILLWATLQSWGRKKFIYYFAILGCALVSVILFNSRGSMLGLGGAIALVIAMLVYFRKFKSAILVLVIALLVGFTAWAFVQNSRVVALQVKNTPTTATVEARLLVWDFSVDQIFKTPVLGTGLGNFFLAYRANQNSALANDDWFDDAHNVVLQYFATAGIIAGLLFLIIIGGAVFILTKRFLFNKDLYAGSIAAAIIVWVFIGCFTPVTTGNWLLLALLISQCYPFAPNFENISLTKWKKTLFYFFGTIFIVLGVCMLTSEIYLWQSREALDNKDFGRAEKLGVIAYQVFPYNTNAKLDVANALLEEGKVSELETLLTQIRNQHPSSSGIYVSLSQYYVSLYLDTKDDSYRTKAVSTTESMVAFNSNYNPQLQLAISNFFTLKEYTKARDYSLKAVVLNKLSAASWLDLAKSNYYLNNKKDTLFALNQAYKLSPSLYLRDKIDQIKAVKNIQDVPFPFTEKQSNSASTSSTENTAKYY